jgi:hypothetical protein
VAAPVLVYSTPLGGAGFDVAVDSAGNAFVLGYGGSPDFSYFVAKLSPLGELIFLRRLEMPRQYPAAIALDPAGSIYIAGTENFGEGSVGSEANEGFVAKLGPDGTGLLYNTFFRDRENTEAFDLAVDALGKAYVYFTSDYGNVTGVVSFSPAGSSSPEGWFGGTRLSSYVTAMALASSGELLMVGTQGSEDNSGSEAFLLRTNPSSGAMVETVFDSSGTILPLDVAGAPGGGAVVVGMVGRILPSGVPEDGFYIARFGPAGEEVFSRVLDLGAAQIRDVAVTSSGEIVLAGDTSSGSPSGAFVLRLDGGTGQVLSSINLGGYGYAYADSVAVGPGGDAYVVGSGLIARISENRPPDCSRSTASPSAIWPPDRRQVRISTLGVTDPDGDPVTLKVTRILQDELFTARMPDAGSLGTAKPWVRADRMDSGDGRVYHLFFEAKDPAGASCTGEVKVCVPLQSGGTCRDGGARIDSTIPR